MPPRSRSHAKPEPPRPAAPPPDVYRPGEILRTPRVRRINVDVYKTTIDLVIGGSRRQAATMAARKATKVTDLPELTDEDLELMRRPAGSNWVFEKSPNALIWIPKIPKTAWDFGVVTHEAVHVAGHVLHFLGVRIEPPVSDPAFVNDEPLTYLAEFIAREIFTFCDDLTDEWKASRKSRR